MSLTPATRLGVYEITAQIGEGGMGVVYRARDTKLNRDVAIKVLPEAFALDADRLARFTREAQVLASLNHSNIAAIYGIEETRSGGSSDPPATALVMELVEGEDLSQRISRGALPLDEALPIARQIAEALEAAHEQGIVHRDLKPANVKVRPDGTVKVLDFGLAKALDQGSGIGDQGPGGAANSPTITTPAMTMRGMILGTAAYMSPEQARGKAVDRRADIWAFGVVLFEMLTGRRAFDGEDTSVTLANVIKEAPPWDALPANLPTSMRRLLLRCLEKDRRKRLDSIRDARLELDDAAAGGREAVTAAPPSRARERVWMLATAVSVLGAAALALWLWPRPAAPASPVRLTLAAPAGADFPFGDAMMAISPDGRRLALITGQGRGAKLWIRPLDSLTAQEIPGTERAFSPAWSPDSRFVVFNAPSSGLPLKRVDAAGGPVVTLAPAVGINNSAWSRSGVILFTGTDGRLYQVSDSGGTPTSVMEFDPSRQETAHRWPVFLSDGRRFVFNARSNDPAKSALFLASLDAPGRTHLVDVLSSVAYASGHLIYQREGSLMAQPFDERRGQIVGEPVRVAEGVDYNAGHGHGNFSVSSTGTLVYRSRSGANATALSWFDAAGKAVGTVGGLERYGGPFRLSPDRTRIVVAIADGKGVDLWVIDAERGVPSRLTFDPAFDTQSVWFPDSSRIAFRSERNGRTGIYQRSIGGAGRDELLFESAEDVAPRDFSNDGKLLLIERQMGSGQGWDVWALPMAANAKPLPVVATPFDDRGPVFSPDGRWLAYYSDKAGGSPQVYVQSYPEATQEIRISTDSGQWPAWSADGRRLFYMTDDDEMMSVDLSFANGTARAEVPVQLFQQRTTNTGHYFGFDPVGPRFLLTVEPVANQATPLTVVLNWAAGLKK